jgi:hypothetical protein
MPTDEGVQASTNLVALLQEETLGNSAKYKNFGLLAPFYFTN